MSNENTEVKSFFTRYEAANAIFDVEQIAACYAEVFMFGGPEGVQCVKKEDIGRDGSARTEVSSTSPAEFC